MFIDFLSWNQPPSVQADAIKELENIDDSELLKLIQPNDKDCWGNAAKVICNIGYPRIDGILTNLLKWLQDLNWPGAIEIYNLLLTIPKDKLMGHIENAIAEAIQEDDKMWLYWIKDFAVSYQLKKEDFFDKKNYDAIKDIEI